MNMMPTFDDDSMTEHGAIRLANRIRRHWRDHGHEIHVWSERIDQAGSGRGTAWHVRSNLINGLPQVNPHG